MQDRRQSGRVPPAFYGLDSMVHKAFRRIYCQNIQQVYEFRNYLIYIKKARKRGYYERPQGHGS